MKILATIRLKERHGGKFAESRIRKTSNSTKEAKSV